MKPKTLYRTRPEPAVDPASAPFSSSEDRNEVILRYAPLIKHVAHRLAMRLPSHICVDDLISAGVIGLMDAVSKFDPEKKVEFKTYAEFRIRGAMIDELRTMDWVPRSLRQKATQIERTIQQLERRNGRAVEDEEIASAMGLSLDEYYRTLKDLQGLSPIDPEEVLRRCPRVSIEDVVEILAGEEENNPFHQYSLNELKGLLSRAIDTLSEKERTVLSLYYYEELTLKEIGEVLGLTESRICQIHAKAILKLRSRLKAYLREDEEAPGPLPSHAKGEVRCPT
ncbi:MAG: FliA/WhiG family RNA polymerase sigma factor [Desulfobacterota bacterium]|nr:FliA/WhiG family RNA polymerase sigma factor [Thermodesulfobacteriota bacterium]